jgi:hypothetical protein
MIMKKRKLTSIILYFTVCSQFVFQQSLKTKIHFDEIIHTWIKYEKCLEAICNVRLFLIPISISDPSCLIDSISFQNVRHRLRLISELNHIKLIRVIKVELLYYVLLNDFLQACVWLTD